MNGNGNGDRVDLARLVGEEVLAALLRNSANHLRSPLAVLDGEEKVVGAFGYPAGEEVPAEIPLGGDDAPVHRPVVVYDRTCGYAVSPAPDAAAAARAASFAADLVSAVATREYETESLSKNLLDVYEEVNLFYGITARMHAIGTKEGICSTILDRACEIVKAARASILLADDRTGVMRVVAHRGLSAEEAGRIRVRPGEGITGKVLQSGQAMLVDDVAQGGKGKGKGSADDRYASRSFISVPVRVYDPAESAAAAAEHRTLGVLNMTDKADAGTFSSGDMKLLSALASQAAVLLDNTRLAGIEREMGLARRIQASLLPQAPPKVKGAELAGVCIPARNVGGDYYDMVALPDGRVAVLIADVSGHNVGAALMMAVSRAALRSEILRDVEPDRVVARVNSLLEEDLARSELFVSVFVAVFDPASGRLAYANAGHNHPLLLRAGSREPEHLDAEGILLGVLGDYPFERKETRLAPGDILLLYTDGFTEAMGAGDDMFGEERLGDALAEVRDRPVAEIPGALLSRVEQFSSGAAPDDRTAAVLRACTMGPA